ncbi:hypothetical protein AA0117_g10956 [Alternaria alternata]|uniref:Uncharacterized protein n=1 Tax=Alternaria alternata TaxID=5599 RepID=A0A4Q4N3R2_ALTAL|nr:hypothetical protein AA0117_g10956 [Alternaria alternata]
MHEVAADHMPYQGNLPRTEFMDQLPTSQPEIGTEFTAAAAFRKDLIPYCNDPTLYHWHA